MVGEPEQQTLHTVEEVGWLHHAWDEVGPQLVTGVLTGIGLALAAFVTVWSKHKFFPKAKP